MRTSFRVRKPFAQANPTKCRCRPPRRPRNPGLGLSGEARKIFFWFFAFGEKKRKILEKGRFLLRRFVFSPAAKDARLRLRQGF
ncbi:hypothetical protein [Deefgea piscis]|uniref:hypothetical protein n=1 Tax=Deefgea piscis TaxID=2739061 RepID=UPI001C7E8CAF|nr:hypothetical protein [Deefgea piscis]QZA79724.1 hypothetical protein K4H25_09130 [Deefgea piscis]